MRIEITFVNRGRGGYSVGVTKQFTTYSHARNFKRKWTFDEWYCRINGQKATAEQLELLK